MSLESFRAEVRAYIDEHCPDSMKNRTFHFEDAHEIYSTDDAHRWLNAMAEKGLTTPTWPKEYGAAGLDYEENRVFQEEMSGAAALPPLSGMGIAMIGPTLLEFGTEEQKARHLPKIVSGEVTWCQGYSEPGSGSDLASLQTRAVLTGDHFVINGQKIWTSGAQHADWMFALVRTDPEAAKHDGISFVLLDMHQPGVTTKPIGLISGSSPFCETFFDDAVARRDDLVGEMNKGWTVGKRLLQYERSSAPAARSKKKAKPVNSFAVLGKQYCGESAGKIADVDVRDRVLNQTMLEKASQLTVQRVADESRSGKAPGATTSIFKYVGSTLSKEGSSLKSYLRGVNGVAWEGEGFSGDELEATRSWLRDRAVTIYGGTNEVQLNIISKRVLGLPD
jgi:alkylation response protein AidB-like acyl-CoA dehydrogenase